MNRCTLIGNLVRDPELTETSGGIKVCRFSIAVSRNYTAADGERKTDFFNCIAWRGLGENVARYMRKGSKVAVAGSVELRNYEDKQGLKRTSVEILAQDVEFLTSGQGGYNGEGKANRRSIEELDDETATPFAKQAKQQRFNDFDNDNDIPF